MWIFFPRAGEINKTTLTTMELTDNNSNNNSNTNNIRQWKVEYVFIHNCFVFYSLDVEWEKKECMDKRVHLDSSLSICLFRTRVDGVAIAICSHSKLTEP